MSRSRQSLIQLALLLALALRTALGAPCCIEMPHAAASHAAQASIQHAADHTGHGAQTGHAHHYAADATQAVKANGSASDAGHDGHEGHGEDPSANPCCSACGPTLPPQIAPLAARSPSRDAPAPAPIRALPKRAPLTAYDARGPPRLI